MSFRGVGRVQNRRLSTQVKVLQRLLSLCNEHTEALGFTLDDLVKWPVFQERHVPRGSVRKALERFIKLEIVSSPGTNSDGQRLYRIKNSLWANDYIEGNPDKPWIPLTPTPPKDDFLDYDEHRDHFDIELTRECFERLRGHFEASNGQHTWRTKAFTLSVNGKSLLGQLFVRPYWRTEVRKLIGDDFYNYLVEMEVRGGMRGDFTLPLDVKNQRFFLGGRPTQFSASHYPAQLDVRRSRDDSHVRDGLLALTNQADFNIKTLDFEDAVLETLKKQGEVQTRQTELLKNIMQQLQITNGKKPDEPPYQPPSEDKRDYSYR